MAAVQAGLAGNLRGEKVNFIHLPPRGGRGGGTHKYLYQYNLYTVPNISTHSICLVCFIKKLNGCN